MEAEDALIGRKIFDLRVEQDIAQHTLAAALQLHVSVLNRIEKGSRPIRATELRLVAQFFNVSTDFLLGLAPQHDHNTRPTVEQHHLYSLSGKKILPVLAADEEALLCTYRHLDERGRTAVKETAQREAQFSQQTNKNIQAK